MSAEANWEADVYESSKSLLCVCVHGFCSQCQCGVYCLCIFLSLLICVCVFLAKDRHGVREKKANGPSGCHHLYASETVNIILKEMQSCASPYKHSLIIKIRSVCIKLSHSQTLTVNFVLFSGQHLLIFQILWSFKQCVSPWDSYRLRNLTVEFPTGDFFLLSCQSLSKSKKAYNQFGLQWRHRSWQWFFMFNLGGHWLNCLKLQIDSHVKSDRERIFIASPRWRRSCHGLFALRGAFS